jgi:predicted DCC family thiol-disulfide oxidoreductase YuxK
MATTTQPGTAQHDGQHEIEAFYDGECPLCIREVKLLRRLDKEGHIKFTDITAKDFDAQRLGIDQSELMKQIHARLPDGRIVTGVEVFRRLYSAVGWTWPVALSRLPGVRQALDVAYRVFARNRRWLTGRSSEKCDRCATN